MAIVARPLVGGGESFWVCLPFDGRQRWHLAGRTRAQALALEEFLRLQVAEGRYVPKREDRLIYDEILPVAVPGVYAVAGVPGYVKFGSAKTSIAARMRELQVGHPVALRLLAILHDDPSMEPLFHGRYRAWRSHGEWYVMSTPIVDLINRATEDGLRRSAEESVFA